MKKHYICIFSLHVFHTFLYICKVLGFSFYMVPFGEGPMIEGYKKYLLYYIYIIVSFINITILRREFKW